MQQYAIWIIPQEPVYSTLKQAIDQLAKEFSSPTFEPHMTLLVSTRKELSEIEQLVRELANQTEHFEVSLGSVSFSTTYFQSVFVRVNSTAKLMQLNLDAKNLLQEENNVFMPHISLLYGEHDMATREKAADKIVLPHSKFMVASFVITPATLNPKDWQHLVTIPLINEKPI